MSLWRLEWLRLVRTKRWLALLGVYLFFGFVGPVIARYLSEILSLAGGELEGAVIEIPPPVPADGMGQYVSNAMQVGTLIAVAVAAGALAFDAVPEMGVFLRSRVDDVRTILTPRFVVTAAAVSLSFLAGALAAWFETTVLIGELDAFAVLAGAALGMLYLIFVVAMVGAVAGWARSILGTVMASIVILLVMPLVGVVGPLGRWLPSHLAGALGALPAGAAEIGDYLGATVVTVAISLGLVWLSLRLARQREL
jgi:ABC-2 type transport system permease protein